MNDLEDRVKRALRAEAEAGGLEPPPGAWDAVVAGADAINRRRWVRTGVAIAVAVAIIGSGAHVLGSTDRVDEQLRADRPSEAPLPFPEGCASSSGPPPPEPLQPEDVDDLRFIPTWLPEGETIQLTYAERTSECPRADDVEPVLVLRAMQDSETIGAVISLHGPFALPPHPPDRDLYDGNSYTNLRGTTAHIEVVDNRAAELMVTWTEPDETSWTLSSSGVDGETLLAVGEALELDSTGEHADSFARVSPDELPAGFEAVWQASHLPAPPRARTRAWVVDTPSCQIRLEQARPNAAVEATMGQPGDRAVTMSGDRIGWFGQGGVLRWDAGQGVTGTVDCDISPGGWDADTAARQAESLVPVDVNDSRLRLPVE
jgi:hypothetical protein